VAIGPVSDPKLNPGEWRELTPKEVKSLARKPAKPRVAAVKKTPATPAVPPKKRIPVKDRVATTKSAEKRRATALAHAEKNESRKARGQ
jgi:hypothetical protein